MIPKPDSKRKQKSGFRSFTEEEFEECSARLIEENREVSLVLGRS
jgi:hypothetical protein